MENNHKRLSLKIVDDGKNSTFEISTNMNESNFVYHLENLKFKILSGQIKFKKPTQGNGKEQKEIPAK